MTDAPMPEPRPYSPGLEGVIAGETSLGYVDGERGRLLYRGYRIGDLVERGTYPAVANLLWTGDWDPGHRLPTAPVPRSVLEVLRALPTTTKPMDALRTAVSAWGATQDLPWPPTAEQARAHHLVLAVGAGGLRPPAGGPAAGRARSRARSRRRVPLPAQGRPARRGHRPGARRVLHRRLGARLQRLHVHGTGRHLDALRHRVGRGRRDRDDEGPAPRRGAVGGRGPAQPGRVGGPCRGLGPRRAGARASG